MNGAVAASIKLVHNYILTQFSLHSRLFILTVALTVSSCKKNGAPQPDYDDSTIVNETMTIKVIATQPSPWDSAHGPFSDSLTLNQEVPVGGQLTGVNTSTFKAGPWVGGFALSYSGVFLSSYDALPMIYGDFLVNHIYNDTTTKVAFVISWVNGNGPGRYFNGPVPADGTAVPTATYYTQAYFTKKFTSTQLGNYDTTYFASGQISGHEILSYGTTNPNKYVQRWDFVITFNNLTYNVIP